MDAQRINAQLVFKIGRIMKEQMLHRQFSVERLVRFVVALDQDIEIVCIGMTRIRRCLKLKYP